MPIIIEMSLFLLVAVAGSTRGSEAALATSVYALTVMLLFGTSATYHRVRWSTPARPARTGSVPTCRAAIFFRVCSGARARC